jgi:hypothetical protein
MRRLLDQSRTRFAAQARAFKREAPFFRVMRAVIERIRRSSLLAKEVQEALMGRFHEILRRITSGHPRLVAHHDAEKPSLTKALQRGGRPLNRSHVLWVLKRSHLLIQGAVPIKEDRRCQTDAASPIEDRSLEKSLCSGNHFLDHDRPHASMINGAVTVVTGAAGRRLV